MNRIRNNNMYQRPESIDPGFVDIAPLQLFNPAIAEMGKDVLSKAQERYDASQAVIAKYIEDYGSTPMREADKINVMNKLQSDLDRLHQEVKTKGVGYADSLPEIIKSLSKARGTLHLAKQDYEKEQALRKQYDAQVVSGKAPRTIGRDDDGRIVEKPMTFEEFSKGLGVSNSGFDETGQYKGYNTMSIRGRGEHDKWTMENISEPIMKGIIEGRLGNAGYGYLESIMKGGMSDDQVEELFQSEHGKDYVNSFLTNSDFASEEFKNDDGTINVPLAKEYLKDLVKVQTSEIVKKQYMQDPSYKVATEAENPFDINPYDSKPNPIDSKAKIEKIKSNFEKFRADEKYIGDASAILNKRAELEPKLEAFVELLSDRGVVDLNGVLRQINNNINGNENQGILGLYKEFYPEDSDVYKLNNGNFTIVSGKIGAVALKLSRLIKPENNVFKNVDKYTKDMNEYFSKNHAFLYSEFQQGGLKKQDMINIAEEEETAKAKTFDNNYILKQPKSKEYLETQLKSSTSIMPAKKITAKGVVEESDESISEILNQTGRTIETIEVNPLNGLDVVTVKDGKKETYRVPPKETTIGIGNVLYDISSVLNNFYSSPEKRSEIPLTDGRIVVIERELKDNKIIKKLGLDLGDKIVSIKPNEFVNYMLDNLENISGEKVEQKTKKS